MLMRSCDMQYFINCICGVIITYEHFEEKNGQLYGSYISIKFELSKQLIWERFKVAYCTFNIYVDKLHIWATIFGIPSS